MRGAAPAVVRFYCPECGAGVRTDPADAGACVGCHRCAELIRVPLHPPHPLESGPDDVPLISPAAAVATRSGVALLRWSLWLGVAGTLVAATLIGYRVAVAGPAAVLAGEPGPAGRTVLAAWALDLLIVAVGAALRVVGYGRCRTAGLAVAADGWVTAARAGVAARSAGYAAATGPLAFAPFLAAEPFLPAAAGVGLFVWVAGTLLEFGVLVVWFRLLAEARSRSAAAAVTRYLYGVAGAVVGTAVAVALAGTVVVLSLQRDGLPAPWNRPNGLVDFHNVPPEGWQAALAVVGFVSAVGLLLCWRYSRLLAGVRDALSGAPNRF